MLWQVSMLEDMAKRSAARVSAVATDAEQAQHSDWMLGWVWGKARDAVGINLWSAFCSLSRTWRHESGMALPFFVRNITACDVLRLPIWLWCNLSPLVARYRLGEIEAKSRKEGKEMQTKLTKLESITGVYDSAYSLHVFGHSTTSPPQSLYTLSRLHRRPWRCLLPDDKSNSRKLEEAVEAVRVTINERMVAQVRGRPDRLAPHAGAAHRLAWLAFPVRKRASFAMVCWGHYRRRPCSRNSRNSMRCFVRSTSAFARHSMPSLTCAAYMALP